MINTFCHSYLLSTFPTLSKMVDQNLERSLKYFRKYGGLASRYHSLIIRPKLSRSIDQHNCLTLTPYSTTPVGTVSSKKNKKKLGSLENMG